LNQNWTNNNNLNKQKHPFYFSVDSLNTAIFALFFILLPVIYINQVFETASIPRHILIASIACILLLLLSFKFFTKEAFLHIYPLHIALFSFFCWALLSILWSVDIKNSAVELTQLSFYFIIAFTASQLNHKEQIRKILFAIYIGATIAALIGILQAFNFNPFELKMTTPLASTFNNKNHASVFFDLVIPLALISMLTSQSYEKHIACVTYTLAVTFILLAKTKGSMLGYIVFSLFFLIFIYKNKSIQIQFYQKKNIIHYLALSFIVPISIYALTTVSFIDSHTPAKWNTDLTKESTSIRFSWYKNAFAMLEDYPLTGVGYGAFRKGFAPYASSPNIVQSLTEDQAVAQLHNDPYQNLLESGVIGGGLIILIFSYIVIRGSITLSTIQIKNRGSPFYLLLGSFLALIGSITHSFVDFPMRLPSSAVLFWFIVGLVIVLLPTRKKIITFNKRLVSTSIGIGLLLITFFLSVHSFDLYHRYFSASKLAYIATVSIIKEQNCPKAKNEIDQAINLFFEDAFIRHRYVQIYSRCNLSPETKLAAMNRVLDYDLTNARARLTRATLYLDIKELKLARADFNYLTYVLPHRPAAYLGLGDIATLKKDFIAARKYYEKAKILDPKNQKSLFMLNQFNEKGV